MAYWKTWTGLWTLDFGPGVGLGPGLWTLDLDSELRNLDSGLWTLTWILDTRLQTYLTVFNIYPSTSPVEIIQLQVIKKNTLCDIL